jgi:hypothetical protein
MRKAVYILTLILLYLLFTAKSCDNEEQSDAVREEAHTKAAKDSISAAFGTDTLCAEALMAFEATARLKLYDLVDYLQILSDSTIEKGFKEKLEKMVIELFVPDDGNLELITESIKNLNGQGGVAVDSVKVQKSLQKVNDSLYSGHLMFFIHPLNPDLSNKKTISSAKFVEIFVAKREKKFGNNSLKVWTVLLGEIM